MRAIIVLKKVKDNIELTRRIVEKLEMDIEEIIDVERANFDSTTFKLYVDIDDEAENPPGHADFYNAIQKWEVFRVINIAIA